MSHLSIDDDVERENLYSKEYADNIIMDDKKKEFHYNENEELISHHSEVDIIKQESSESESKSSRSNHSSFKEIFAQDLENINSEGEGEIDKIDLLLFCCQNIGKFIDENKTRYEKNEMCEMNLRDIHLKIMHEDPEFPQGRYYLLKWKIIEKDIIPLLVSYPEIQRIQMLGFVILVGMTQSLSETSQYKNVMMIHLTQAMSYISNDENFFKHLGNILSAATVELRNKDFMRKELLKNDINIDDEKAFKSFINGDSGNPEEDKEKMENINKLKEIKKKIAEVENKNQQLIELIFTFLKQIFNVYSINESWKNAEINLNFIKKMSDNKIFDAIIFHTTNFESDFYKRISFNFLELMHFIFREFTVQQIFDVSSQDQSKKNESLFKKLRDEEKRQEIERRSKLSTRHNNFGTTIQVKRQFDNTSYIVSNLNCLNEKAGLPLNQKKKPKQKTQYKKHENEINDEIKFLNDLKIKENFLIDPSNAKIFSNLRSFCENFLEVSFGRLIKYVYTEIAKESDRLEKFDIYYFFSVASFFIDFHRFSEYAKINEMKKNNDHKSNTDSKSNSDKKSNPDNKSNTDHNNFKFNIQPIKSLIVFPILEYAYKTVFEESLKSKLSERKIFKFYSALKLIKSLLTISIDLHKLKDEVHQELELYVLIQDSLLARDYTRVIKYAFSLYNPNIFPKKMLYEIIEFCELYFYCLEMVSKIKKIKIKEKKRRRKQKNEGNEEDMIRELDRKMLENKDFIEKDSQGEDSQGEHTGSSISFSDDEYEYKERDLDISNEIKILLDYTIISKFLTVLNELNNLNRTQLKIVAKIFTRIASVKGNWIFYQVEYLMVFKEVLNNSEYKSNNNYRDILFYLKQIVKEFFDLSKTNKLIFIEALFKYKSQLEKDEILNNYERSHINENYLYVRNDLEIENENIYGDEYNGNNLFPSKNSSDEEEKKVEWTENEDLVIIENYFKFKDFDNLQEILEGLLFNKKSKDIKKRIKKLKLYKRKTIEKAIKKMKKIHLKSKKTEENNEQIFNVIIDLSDKCQDEIMKKNLEKTINSLKSQLESYKIKKGLSDSTPIFTIMPNTEEEFEIWKDKKFQILIKNLGFIQEGNEGMMLSQWVLSRDKDNYNEIEILIGKLEDYQNKISENIHPKNQENKNSLKNDDQDNQNFAIQIEGEHYYHFGRLEDTKQKSVKSLKNSKFGKKEFKEKTEDKFIEVDDFVPKKRKKLRKNKVNSDIEID